MGQLNSRTQVSESVATLGTTQQNQPPPSTTITFRNQRCSSQPLVFAKDSWEDLQPLSNDLPPGHLNDRAHPRHDDSSHATYAGGEMCLHFSCTTAPSCTSGFDTAQAFVIRNNGHGRFLVSIKLFS